MDGQAHRFNRGALFVSTAKPSCRMSKHGNRSHILTSDRGYPLVAQHPTRAIDCRTNVAVRPRLSTSFYLSFASLSRDSRFKSTSSLSIDHRGDD